MWASCYLNPALIALFFYKLYFNNILSLRLGLRRDLFPENIPTKPLHEFIISIICASFPDHLIHSDLMIFGDACRLLLIMHFSPPICYDTFFSVGKDFSQAPCCQTSSFFVLSLQLQTRYANRGETANDMGRVN